jgi:hypothetical protein
MKMSTMVIIGLLVFIIGFLVIYSQRREMVPSGTSPYSLQDADQPPAGKAPAAAGGYGTPATGGYGKSQ